MSDNQNKPDQPEPEEQALLKEEDAKEVESQDDDFSPLESGPETALFWQ
ncbi:hypothetical protein ACODM8_04340 [Vibrio ostreicida]